jgi:phosphonate degradation associated HDIG domain protein
MLTLDDIATLFAERGHEQYTGEPVTQLEHALQTAALGEAEGADDELVTAALLHDLGHLLHDLGETPTLRGVDDVHQYRALPFLRGLFSDRVLGAIGLHVDAKRYLCATQPGYHDALSDDSKRSLVLQGGVFGAAEAAAFAARPGALDAVRLRRWDDLAKAEGLATPPLAHYLARARRVVSPSAALGAGLAEAERPPPGRLC